MTPSSKDARANWNAAEHTPLENQSEGFTRGVERVSDYRISGYSDPLAYIRPILMAETPAFIRKFVQAWDEEATKLGL